jgi:chromate transporter
MVLGPACIVVALGIAWQHYGDLPSVRQGLAGMSAVAIGLILATAVKMGINLFRPEQPRSDITPRASYWTTQRIVQVLLCAAGFVGVGLLHWPLAAVVAGLAPIAIGVSWHFARPPAEG